MRVPAETDEELPAGPVRLTGLVKYRAHADNGSWLPPEAVAFSLALGAKSGTAVGESISAKQSDIDVTAPSADGERLSGFLGRLGVVGLLIGCFLYGLFLNATPCVLPVLSIKVLGFVQQAHESRRWTLALGLAFGAGVTVLFVLLGFLAAAGKNVLQYPAAVIGLSAVVTALALAMLGVYTLQTPAAATRVEASIRREGLVSSFGKGALAPVLGFACTGPLLAGAFGWATQQPPPVAVVGFLFAGLGMASPYVLLGANPNWLSFLPKPGQWMVTFERIMGFLLLAMVIWLLSPLVTQVGAAGLQWTLVFMVAVGIGCWLLGKIDPTTPVPLRWRYRGGAAAIVLGTGVLVYGWIYPLDEARARQQNLQLTSYAGHGDRSSKIPWQPWSPEAVETAARSGKIVFVDFTAAYCTVCKANRILALDTPEVCDKVEALGVVPFRGDFTSGDPKVFAVLKKHNRTSVPLNLIHPAGKYDNPIVLRPQLTKKYLLQKLDEAGSSHNDAGGSTPSG